MHTPKILTRGVLWTLALGWLAVTLLPLAFVVFTSLKSQQDTFDRPVWALPSRWDWSHYATVLHSGFFTYLRNSVFVVGVSVVLIVLVSAMAAYALSRLKFRFNRALFGLIVAAMIVPLHITLVPIYLMTRDLGLYDTPFALIGPYVATSLPVSIFILTEFMRQIPRELEEAAQIDGCGPLMIFLKIFLPLSGPGIATVAIYNGIHLWNEFIFAYVLTASPGNRTLPLALWDFQGEFSSNIPAMLAVVTLTSLPLIVAYAFGQERIVKGLMAGSLKG
ncbi:carbohydrate ABC transporter permease [Verminephrobacter aporrectodeae]|uniref:carbohydrate ABC transporter permease n=1 Tax=Verminephrobacter aporrectodeae TaxID=1110389 RepID=UPI00023768A2|nr:carbohydrate ABC transporter permease [Verminephrobacter aporrectodeae]MCW5220350.1 carbohydrate ABC transporter permease [Verminephrobacter aporrectodeae subsp. tuberculatae]MCW5255680.1 carbohydrate ABC transporter permease [Verminephrobacter aporrectodeae subsp. tuberculatae]MCW5289646.1 carbohydrate ABC transporter permease [Verminephrobacter aporrectodeae subsp. tuberculatae]MCW8166818.1 carbohydrate ABC transporter permease [Verminephrobacter aporrectodeae subsp. tuberculatae]MCW81709